uniref:IPTL-CTERM sorting domain-containing protein n=1 Tax=Thiocapsa bogorovii TaxID=521689 RepID=UPI0038CD0FE1
MWGGGAGGRDVGTAGANAGGGGGGFAAINDFAVSAGANFDVVVGQGGAVNTRGGSSAFGGTAPDGCIGTTAPACAAGGQVTVPPGSFGGCAAGFGDVCVGDTIFAGGAGNGPGGSTTGGGGGGSAFTNANGGDGLAGSAGGTGGIGQGNGGNGGTVGLAGTAGVSPGGGGGGKGAGAGVAPGAGAPGLVIVTYELDPPPPPASATAIPTASTWGLLLLGGLLSAFGARRLRSQK